MSEKRLRNGVKRPSERGHFLRIERVPIYMKSIMKMLYNGELYPVEKLVPKNPDYRKFNREISEIHATLKAHLSENEQKALEKLGNLYQDVESMTDEESFIYGMRLGMLLMSEAFEDDESSLKGE